MEFNKEEYLKEFGEDYGYPNGPKSIDDIRATEFKRLDQKGTVYLDHAGATLYSELQMEAIFKNFTSNVYGNPHSQSDSSMATSDIVREARQQVLQYCNASAKDYTCVFTSGATSAFKLIGEAFPWSCQSCFMYTMENHNSVLGIREFALSQGATAVAVDVEESTCHQNSVKLSQHSAQRRNQTTQLDRMPMGNAYSLFAFPLECNFSGVRFNLDLVNYVKEDTDQLLEGSPFCKSHWVVLIDAAKGCATQPPDLSKFPADFVVISFYKLFGYPTGLGALIARKDAAKLLKKTYFSGGTVAASFADVDFVKRREGFEELFEDGTSSFLSIASLHHGFRILNSLTATAIFRHTSSLTKYVKQVLLDLKHENGAGVCTLYGNDLSKVLHHESGPIISFNLKRPDGSWFGYREVEKVASLSGIQLRTGCFCNPGACAKYLGLSHLDLLSNLEAGHVCWDDNDIINGKPTGAVRISFGYMSTYEDCKKFIDFITNSFMQMPNEFPCSIQLRKRSIIFPSEVEEKRIPPIGHYLKAISIYPIKSCGGFSAESWPLSSTGLRHDREWLLRSLTGEILTQKKVPEMYYITTFIDLHQGIMSVGSPRCRENLLINISTDFHSGGREEIELQAQRYEVELYDNEVNMWFSNAVGRPCSLLRCLSSSNYSCLSMKRNLEMCRDVATRVNFPNEAQFLLISEESLSDLNNRLSSNGQKGKFGTPPMEVNPQRFRPNLFISGGEPYAEDRWKSLRVGSNYFVSLGGCNRCQMINLVHQAGQVQKSNEPLATLASYRRVKGKILFGILLRYETDEKAGQPANTWLRVGEEVHPDE